MSEETKFPWLLSNIVDTTTETDQPLADGKVKHVITWHGVKLGFIGLVEEEWIETLSTIDPEDVEYTDYVIEGRRLAQELRKEGVDYVIALTHMRWPSDIRLAENVAEIDLILGGHDHDFGIKEVNGKMIIKSGTDFRNYALVTLEFSGNNNTVSVDVQEASVDSSIPEDGEMKAIVEQFKKLVGEKMDKVLGHIGVDLDGRFAIIRHQESNLGNFITDIMLRCTEADVAILNSGTMRSDRIHPRGVFKMRDVMTILPYMNSLVVLAVTGKQLVAALENGVSEYPALEGRFPQVAGIGFSFDPTKPPGERVSIGSVTVEGEPLFLDQTYQLCVTDFLAKGKDGYDCLVGSKVIMNEDDGPLLSTVVRNHFQSVSYMTGQCKLKYRHHQSLIARRVRKSISKQQQQDETDTKPSLMSMMSGSATDDAGSRWKMARIALSFTRRSQIEEAETEEAKVALEPKVQQRMKTIGGAA